MSQYHIPIHLPLPSPSSNPATLPERSGSVSTISTIGSPFSQTPAPHLVATLPSQLHSPSPSQELTPAFPSVLDSNLHLSARKLKSEFHRRDITFARLIVAILAQRIEMGILAPVNGIGFPFTEKDERRKSCRSSGWDVELGFNVHGYKERYPNVLALARQDLEIRGFIVEKLEIEPDENGIYIKYVLGIPEH